MRRTRAEEADEALPPTSPISKSSVDNDGDDTMKVDYDGRISNEKGNTVSESSFVKTVDDEEVQRFNGEPVITNGRDVSRYVVDLRDDGDPALTLRSLTLGTVFAGLGAALCQIYQFKPVQMTVSMVFLLLLTYTAGNTWAKVLPTKKMVTGTRFEALGPILEILNPGPFGLKEHAIASLVASTAAGQSTAVLNFAVQRLYYDTHVEATTAVLATFSTACFGYGLVGLLRPLTVYPSEMVYWFVSGSFHLKTFTDSADQLSEFADRFRFSSFALRHFCQREACQALLDSLRGNVLL